MKAALVLELIFGLVGGLGIFLIGMKNMSEGMQAVAGSSLRKMIAAVTSDPLLAVSVGTMVTTLIQSSSITTVMVVGFVNSSVMTLQQAIGVIMGANIDTTITAQIIAFKVTHFALAFIALGFFLQFIFKRDTFKNYGNIVLGLGLIFLGMTLMTEGMEPLRTYPPFTHPITTHIQSANSNERGFDIEFEPLSGNLLLVHAGPDANPLYRIWSDGAWSADQLVFDLGATPGTTLWVQLVPRPNTDEIAMVALDEQMRVVASIWDGATETWTAPQLLGSEIVEIRDFRAFDAAWESLSGDLLVAWGFSVFAEQTRYATRDGQTGAWTTG